MGLEEVTLVVKREAQGAAIGDIAEYLAVELHDVIEGINTGGQLCGKIRGKFKRHDKLA